METVATVFVSAFIVIVAIRLIVWMIDNYPPHDPNAGVPVELFPRVPVGTL